ncbi:uncharacterized protein KY384_007440 [Bacidia gigantensis]|uniref:uncharacterized protein n=1 Tax=Bacidia gigantensis TaxID=2732470 RepID=UPI001D0366E2|nr:uncharacterized protein KY384_007440 [Bacidia gigantensis]KAG8528522.1 hypothetical protein KY384_007440 [Bacidia gigantensis]
MAPESKSLTQKVALGSPYQLDKNQSLKASSALLKNILRSAQTKDVSAQKRNLLADDSTDSADAETVWLVLTTKKNIVPQPRLKPGKILLPHSLNIARKPSICLLTPDPQRQYKDLVAHSSFPPELATCINRVIGLEKLKKKYHSYESQRQLRDSHDIFLADDKIITYLSKTIGKTFYKTAAKRPFPVRLAEEKQKSNKKQLALPSTKAKKESGESKLVKTPQAVAKEVERTLSMTPIYLSPSATTSIRVGLSSQSPQELAENIEAIVSGVTEKYVPRQWRGVKSIHIKGANTMAIPIWLADELWEDDAKVLGDVEAEEKKARALHKAKKKRALENGGLLAEDVQNPETGKRKAKDSVEEGLKSKRSKGDEDGLSQEMKERREKLRQQKKELKVAMERTGSSVKPGGIVKAMS